MLPQRPDFLEQPTFLPRVTRHDGRAIEEALAGPSLFDRGVRLEGAVVEASYAAEEPPLLKRLREEAVPQLIDPQTLRFTGERFVSVERLAGLPYAPAGPITAQTFTTVQAEALARGVMLFQQTSSAACYLAAGLPCYDDDLPTWLDHNERLRAAACKANGGSDLDRRPLIAQLAPGRKALAEPGVVSRRLLDYPIDAVYVQPLRLNPVGDSLEKLAGYVGFLLALRDEGLPVIAGRVGAFGLLLQALGISAFDSGLSRAEAFELAGLNRPLTERERNNPGKGGGPDRRIYFERLKTTLPGRHAARVLADRDLRSRFTCTLGCCEHGGFEELPDRRRTHYLWTRHHEIEELRNSPTLGMREDAVHEQLRDAREEAVVVRRTLAGQTDDLPAFDHLERWIGVLIREGGLSQAAWRAGVGSTA